MFWKPRSIFSFRFCVFDLDGTLIASADADDAVFTKFARPYGIPEESAREVNRSMLGCPVEDAYKKLFAKHGVPLADNAAKVLANAFQEEFGSIDVPYLTGAVDLVRLLHERGTKLFVSSASSDATVQKRLRKESLIDCFTLALGSTRKPKGQRHLLQFAGTIPHTAIRDLFSARSCFCGDGEQDMRIGREAEMYTIGVSASVGAKRMRAAGARRVIASVGDMIADKR